MRSAHPSWAGNPRQYQIEAQRVFSIENDRSLAPWSWITTDCGSEQCLNPGCMTVHAPRRIAYTMGVCVYCGDPAGTVDHLLPRGMTGDALRHLVAVVPACGNCNSRIGAHPSPNVADRRKVAQLSIERTSRKLLSIPDKGPEELLELGYLLRQVAEKNNRKRRWVRLRLSWPDDPFYDLRAFQKSGINDPESLGLCDEYALPLRPEYAA